MSALLGVGDGGVLVEGEVVGDGLVVGQPAVCTDHSLGAYGHLDID